jgi:hypothetical protein
VEKLKADLVWGAWTPLMTIIGVMKSQKDNVRQKLGMFGPDAGLSKEERFKKWWYENSIRRTAQFVADVGTLDKLMELPRTDSRLPAVPCCCAWTM